MSENGTIEDEGWMDEDEDEDEDEGWMDDDEQAAVALAEDELDDALRADLKATLETFHDADIDDDEVQRWYDACPDSENPAEWCWRWLDAGLDFPKVAKDAHLWQLTPEAVRAEIDKLDDASEEPDQRKAVKAARLARDGRPAKEVFGLREIGRYDGAVLVSDDEAHFWVTPESLGEILDPPAKGTREEEQLYSRWCRENGAENPLPACSECGHILAQGADIHSGDFGDYVWGTCPECGYSVEIYEGNEGWPSAELYE